MPRRSLNPPDSAEPLLVEVVDAHDIPLAHMPVNSVLRQKLACRLVAVALTHEATLFVHKPCSGVFHSQEVWDLMVRPVYRGESRIDAGIRAVEEILGFTPAGVVSHITEVPPAFAPVRMTLLQAHLPPQLHVSMLKAPAETLFLDADELGGLCRGTPEMLSPVLLWASAYRDLFLRPRGTARETPQKRSAHARTPDA